MGQKDLSQKQFEDYPDIFADIVNALLYDGEEIVLKEHLKDAPTEYIYNGENCKLHDQLLDIGKFDYADGRIKSLFVIENLSKKNNRIVFRNSSYEGNIYKRQYNNKADYYPVTCLVLYWGKSKWKKIKNLKDQFLVNRRLVETEKIDDTTLRVFNMYHLPKEIRNKFKSDMRAVADYLAEGENYNPGDYRITHVSEFFQLLKAITGDNSYLKLINDFKDKEKPKMCEIYDAIVNKGIAIGEERGVNKGIAIGEERGVNKGIAIGEERGVNKGIAIGEERGVNKGIAIGEERGENKGMELFAKLTSILINDNRIEDLKKATKDMIFLNKLIKEYKLQ